MNVIQINEINGLPPGLTQLARITQRFAVDRTMLVLLLLLSATGFLTIYSTTMHDESIMVRHLSRLAIGFALMFIFAAIPITVYRRWAPILYLVGVVLLLLVLVAGEISKGAQRWLDVWLVRFQPSEVLKITTPLLICSILANQHESLQNTIRILSAMVLIALPVALVFLQPDLGTSLLIATNGAFALFLAGMSWYWIGSISIALFASAPLIWHTMHDYQRQRALAFLNPENDPLGTGYHIIQSKIAIGSGGLWGKGWGSGTQVQLGFIPEHSTDFIFPTFAEQTGFAGVCVLILLYMLLCARCIVITMRAADSFSWLLAGTITFSFAVYFIINIAMVSGLLPVVGLTLPLFSYGGTATVTLLASFGIIAAIAKYRPMMRQLT